MNIRSLHQHVPSLSYYPFFHYRLPFFSYTYNYFLLNLIYHLKVSNGQSIINYRKVSNGQEYSASSKPIN